jgi:hypothetical protein
LRIGATIAALILTTFALLFVRDGAPLGAAGAVAAYAMLMIVPGFALYLSIESDPEWVEALAAGLVASPVLVALVAVPALALGSGVLAPDRALIAAAGAVTVLAAVRPGSVRCALPPRHALVLAAFLALVCVLTAYLPLTEEWWRIRSDAWAHRAYIAEIADFGVPPQDPYFLGFPLQYMWAYHVLILAVSEAANVDPFRTMALVNLQALAGLVLSTYLFAATLTEGFARRMASVVTVTLGLNAAFWVFLPARALKAFTGETRGWEEVARQYTLSPLTYSSATRFMTIFHNKTFFLDKFMVGTAFGLGLCLMAATWYAATAYLSTRRRFPLVLVFLTTAGMLAFHTLVGSVMLAGTFGALALLFFTRRGLHGYALADSIKVAGAMLLALAVASPYVYMVLHSKETVGQTSPVLLAARLAGIAISAAFVLVLFAAQRRFFQTRSPAPRFVLFAWAIILAYALTVPLPGPNSYDKPVFFVFFPAAVVGAWSLVDLARARGKALAVVVAALAILPGNTLALVGSFRTLPEWTVTDDERDVAAWLREHTARDAVLLDDDDRVLFVTAVPRRHLWGRISFAYQWGYDRVEMSRRYHAWRIVYSDRALDSNTLASLGAVEEDLFVVSRRAGETGEVNVTLYPEYFERVYERGALSVYRVDTARCRADASAGRFSAVSEEEILRESGLQ